MAAVVSRPAMVVATTDPADWEAEVLPEEEPLISGALTKRRREFAAGRVCARRALTALGAPPVAILAGRRGEPWWPYGVVGSITHCPGLCSAAVAWREQVPGLGIDAEVHAPMEGNVAAMVCTSRERQWIRSAPVGVHWEMVMFSAKESVYKAWYPLTSEQPDFGDIEVALRPALGVFTAEVGGVMLRGRFSVAGGFVLTSATLTAHPKGRNRL